MSPIHDQGYRRYKGGRAAGGGAWLIIANAGIRTLLGKKTLLGLLLLAWFPFLVRAVQIFVANNVPQAGQLLAVNAETFHDMVDSWYVNLFVFVITVYVGAGLIANDRRANALQIYLAKPLTRAEYVFGKLLILASFLLFITWVPAILLLVVQMMFAGNFTFLRNNVYLFPAITLFSFVYVLTVSTAMLALSSLSKSGRYVGILYAALIFFSDAMYGVLAFVTGTSAISWISYPANLTQIGDVIFRLPMRYRTPWPVSLVMVVILIVGSGLVLERRVRGVEVVS